jgi:hypothetical protein
MAVTADKPGPYTSPQVVVDLISRHRTRGLPSIIDAEVLQRAGVSESLTPRTLQSLVALDLIDEKGQITDAFEALRLAPEAEYKERMTAWLNATYADVLTFIDPATDDETAIRDAFRSYKPVGQQDRMVTLFVRLYAAAGVGPVKAANASSRSRPAPPKTPAARATPSVKAPPPPPANQQMASTGLPAALQGLLLSLPKEGAGWSQERRNKFYDTFGAVLDFCFPIEASGTKDG